MNFAEIWLAPGANRRFYLPRPPREYYQGDAVVHWTLPVSRRRQGSPVEG